MLPLMKHYHPFAELNMLLFSPVESKRNLWLLGTVAGLGCHFGGVPVRLTPWWVGPESVVVWVVRGG